MITAVKVAVQARSDAYLALHHVLGLAAARSDLGLAAARSDLGLAAAVARSLLGLHYIMLGLAISRCYPVDKICRWSVSTSSSVY